MRALRTVACGLVLTTSACAAPAESGDGSDEGASAASIVDRAADVAGATYVDTGTYSVARLGMSRSPVLQTSGVVPCVAVALHDPENHVGALTHIHPSQQAGRAIEAIIERSTAFGLDPLRTVAHVHGGMDAGGSREIAEEVVETLERAGIPIATRDLLGAPRVRSLQLNLQTGLVAPYAETGPNRVARPHDGEDVLYRPAPGMR